VRSGGDWVRPLAASGYCIAFAAAAAALVMRGFQHIGAIPYASLENEIVCENLSTVEIKERFTNYILGSSAAEWLTQQTKLLKEVDKALEEVNISIDATLREIQTSRQAKSNEELRNEIHEVKSHNTPEELFPRADFVRRSCSREPNPFAGGLS
jgi:hypothetical protein